jgi:hypothetical protein
VRPPRAEERWRRDKVGVGPTDEKRSNRRHRYDDPGAGSSHAPLKRIDREFDDFRHRLEAILQGVSKGMWTQI